MARVHMNSNVRKINKNSKTSLPQTIWVGEISVQIEPDTKRVGYSPRWSLPPGESAPRRILGESFDPRRILKAEMVFQAIPNRIDRYSPPPAEKFSTSGNEVVDSLVRFPERDQPSVLPIR
jgi:hypothetical protein